MFLSKSQTTVDFVFAPDLQLLLHLYSNRIRHLNYLISVTKKVIIFKILIHARIRGTI